jgi:prolipoprotein diacylglyceryltransferase
VRALLEPLRDQQDIMYIGNVMVSVVVSIVFILIGIIMFSYFIRNKRNEKIERFLNE